MKTRSLINSTSHGWTLFWLGYVTNSGHFILSSVSLFIIFVFLPLKSMSLSMCGPCQAHFTHCTSYRIPFPYIVLLLLWLVLCQAHFTHCTSYRIPFPYILLLLLWLVLCQAHFMHCTSYHIPFPCVVPLVLWLVLSIYYIFCFCIHSRHTLWHQYCFQSLWRKIKQLIIVGHEICI